MIVERATHPQFLSNTYLVCDGEGGPAFFVDAGGPVAPLIEAAERLGLEPTHVLLTHHHFDHVSEVGALRERWPELEVLIHPLERELLAEGAATGDRGAAGETLRFGTLEVRPLQHARAHGGDAVLPVCAPDGQRGRCYEHRAGRVHGARRGGVHRRHALPRLGRRGAGARPHDLHRPEGLDHGHADGAAAGDCDLPGPRRPEHRRAGVGAQPLHPRLARPRRGGHERCTALGEPATLVLLGDDYDGGHKAWVRWPDGSDDIVPGSQVQAAWGACDRDAPRRPLT